MKYLKLILSFYMLIFYAFSAKAEVEIVYVDVNQFKPMTLFYAQRVSANKAHIYKVAMPRLNGVANKTYEDAVMAWLKQVEIHSFSYNKAAKPITFYPPTPDIMLHSSILIQDFEQNYDLIWLGLWNMEDYNYCSKSLHFHIGQVNNLMIQYCMPELYIFIEQMRPKTISDVVRALYSK